MQEITKDDKDKDELKTAIVQSLNRRMARLSASLTHAVAVGDVEEVRYSAYVCVCVCMYVRVFFLCMYMTHTCTRHTYMHKTYMHKTSYADEALIASSY